jgi:RNA polymerase sigma factor (sigma-70 family)
MMNRRRLPGPRRALSGRDFENFYNEHYGAISRYVGRRLSSNSHDDVVAAVFVVAWRKFDSTPDPSLAWLYRIASFEVAHERRRLSRSAYTSELHDLGLTDGLPLEDVIDVSTAFNQLSERDAEVLRLLHWDQVSRSDAAEIIGCSVNALNVRYHRALQRLEATMHRLSNSSLDFQTCDTPKEER